MDDQGNIVDYIELTLPHDGESAAEDVGCDYRYDGAGPPRGTDF